MTCKRVAEVNVFSVEFNISWLYFRLHANHTLFLHY